MKTNRDQIILGIESSCDETAAAVIQVKSQKSKVKSFGILSNVVSSQVKIHKKYGGVVPEVAARNHLVNIIPVIDEALKTAGVEPNKIDKIAVTYGPGLITSLLVGVETAKTLAYVWGKPLAGVNHLKAHVYSALLSRSQKSKVKSQKLTFPTIALIVSGGHTELVYMKDVRSFKKVGQTVDDAAGEAFDKVAKILGLGYPGGPEISKAAESGDAEKIKLPRPMIGSGDFNFSFAGIKTSVLYKVRDHERNANIRIRANDTNEYEYVRDMAAGFQKAVSDVLVSKTIGAAKKFKTKTIILAGGVAANKVLRAELGKKAAAFGFSFVVPDFKLCTDNAAMVAVAGYYSKPMSWRQIKVDPNLEIGD